MTPTARSEGKHRREAAPGGSEARKRDRALFASVGAGVFARLVTAASSVVSVAFAARALTHDELGVVSILTALVVYFGFADFGMGTLLMTRLPVAHARGDHDEMHRLVSSVMSAMLMVASVVAVLGTLSIPILPWRALLGTEISATDLRWSLLVFVLTGVVGIVGTVGARILAAMQRGALVQMATMLAGVVTVVAVAGCAWAHAPMWTYVLAFSGPVTASGLGQLAYALVRYPHLALDRTVFDFGAGLRLLRSGLQYAVLSTGWVVAYTLDAVVVSSTLGAAEAAIFAIAARLFSLVAGTLTVSGQQMWPAIADALARGDSAWVAKRFRHSLIVAGVVSAASSIVLLVFGQKIAQVWVGAGLVPPLALFAVFAIWTVYMAVITQYSYLLMAADRIRALALLGLLIAAVNLTASIVFTRWLGLVGPVLGNLVAALLVQWPTMVVLTRRMLRELGLRPTRAAHGSKAGSRISGRPPYADVVNHDEG